MLALRLSLAHEGDVSSLHSLRLVLGLLTKSLSQALSGPQPGAEGGVDRPRAMRKASVEDLPASEKVAEKPGDAGMHLIELEHVEGTLASDPRPLHPNAGLCRSYSLEQQTCVREVVKTAAKGVKYLMVLLELPHPGQEVL